MKTEIKFWNENIVSSLLHFSSTLGVIYFNRLSEGAVRPFSRMLLKPLQSSLITHRQAGSAHWSKEKITIKKKKSKASIVRGFNTWFYVQYNHTFSSIDAEAMKLTSLKHSN